jgi:hypothetical protein
VIFIHLSIYLPGGVCEEHASAIANPQRCSTKGLERGILRAPCHKRLRKAVLPKPVDDGVALFSASLGLSSPVLSDNRAGWLPSLKFM